jgi:hypothetical protein
MRRRIKIKTCNSERRFPWSIDEVEEIASEYYDIGKSNSPEERWEWAAREAVRYLVRRRDACERAVRRRKAWVALSQRAKRRVPSPPPELCNNPEAFERAILYVTDQTRIERAMANLRKVFRWKAERPNASLDDKAWEHSLSKWRQRGFSKSELVQLRREYAIFWKRVLAEQNREKALTRQKSR